MDFAKARRTMVDCQLRTFDVHDRAVLAAMDEVARERFLPPGQEELAYLDRNVVTGRDDDLRVMLAPMILGRLIQALGIEAGQKCLDVGTGAGYATAVLARLGARVTPLDEHLAGGAPEAAPFSAILINGAVAFVPEALLGQLADGGRLACLMQDGGTTRGVLFVRTGETMSHRALFDAQAPVLHAFAPAPAFAF